MSEQAERAVVDFMKEMEGGAERGHWDAAQVERVLARMTPDAHYYVYAWEKPVSGADAIREELLRQVPLFRDFSTDIQAIASAGQTVLLQRVDSMTFHDKPLRQHMAAVYEVTEDGKIASWRDYYDSKEVAVQCGADTTTAGSRS